MLLEYALGGEPDRNDAGPMPKGETEGDSRVYRYFRASGRSDVDFTVLISNNLKTWQAAGGMDTSDGPVTALGEPRRVTLPLTPDPSFVRLKMTLIP